VTLTPNFPAQMEARNVREKIAEIERLKRALTAAEAEARRYAESYPKSSDGRNTFLMLADRIAELSEGANDAD
jgi:regulator of protease activity HflC (stomatin/prohibitin superfamily)